jgi:hypothetical protein
MVSQSENGLGCVYPIVTGLLVSVLLFTIFATGRRCGRDAGESMAWSACRQACEARNGVRAWNEDTEACVCRDWSAWRIEAHARRLRPAD